MSLTGHRAGSWHTGGGLEGVPAHAVVLPPSSSPGHVIHFPSTSLS